MKALILAGVLSAWAAFSTGTTDRVEMTEALLSSAAEEILMFYENNGYVPTSADSLGEDPWGNAIRYYRVPSGGFVVLSMGSDGRPGGEGDAADLVVIRLVNGE